MIRYQIRNEYGLSVPGLYAPGEKDDPGALLEGVAMAGLVGVLRQLGDLAEFAAEIFHDLHEDVMATASRGHGLMLRLQQLEAEFPAVEKAIISQTDHSNYPHDDGVEWHANLQLNQNMITQGDMPRFILDSYEECHGPPHLFTLDKFDVAGAGASLKRYSDPSFFKTEHASNMIETDGVIGKKPRKIKKKAMRWRKGETLESLLVVNSESHGTTSKDRASRKVPPRTTKLKSRHPQDSDHKTISRICREQLQEVISSQQKILSNYSARHYHAKFRSTDSSETASSFGELDNFSAPAQSSAKLELTKVVPINEYDTVETASTPISGSVSLEADDGQFLTAQHGPAEVEEVFKRSLVEQNGICSTSEKLQEGPDFKSEESSCALQSVREEKLLSVAVPVNQDLGRCRPDDIGSDQESFVDALNNMESEGEGDHEMKTKRDLSAKMEADKLNCHSKEGENALHVQFSKEGPAIDLSSGLADSCHGGETTCMDSYLIHDSSPSAVPATKDPNYDSLTCRQLNDVDWTNDEEPFNDVDLMDVSSSSSVLSNDNGNSETNDNLNGCEQNPEAGYLSSNDYHAAVAHSSDKQSPQRYSGFNGLAISSNDYTEKAYHSLEHGQNFVLDRPSMIFGKPNDVSQDDEEIEAGNPDDLLLHPTIPNQEEIQFKKQFEEGTSLDAFTSPGKLASLSDMGPVMHMNDLELDNVAVPEKIVANTTPTGLDADDIHWHLDELDSGVAPIHSSMLNNPLYESHDDGILQDLHSLPVGDLYQHVAEDQEIVALGKGPCSTKLNTYREDPVQASIVPRDFSNVQELPGLTESVSSPQDNTEAHAGETLVHSPCVLDDDTKPLLIGHPLASGTASLLNTSSSCVEHCESTDIGKSVSCGEVLVDAEVAEESTTNSFEDDLIPCEEVCTDGAKCTEKAEVLATNSREENSRHDVQLQASSPCREDLETVEATSENLGSLDESREHIFKESMLQTDNLPQLFESETTCETFSASDDIQYLSPLHFPEESVCQEELPEETSLSAEVPCRCDLDKDGAVVSLKSNTVLKQPLDSDQDLMREASAQDFLGTNPFMDPGYIVSHTPTDPSPSMSYLPCFSEEEQDFLSELLIQHDNTGEKENLYPLADSLWEPATPPDEAPLPSEVMTEEDFRSFCHEYHEMDFTAVTEGSDNKPSSDSNDLSNDYVVSELELPCSVSALPVGLDQEACVCSPDSRLAECSSATGIPGKMPFSAKEDSDGETPGVDSDLKSHESFSDEKIPELDVTSVPLGLEQEPHALPGAGSHSSCLFDNGRIGEIYGSPSGIVPVKEEQETFANLVPPAFINEKLDELDVPSSNSVPVDVAVEASGLNEYDYQDIPCSSINEEINELDVLPVSKPFLAQESGVRVLGELDSQIIPSSSIDETIDDRDAPPLRTALEVEQESEDRMSGEHVPQIATSLVNEKMEELDAPPPSNAVLVEKEPKVCVPGELDSQIAPCSLTNEKIYELDGPPSSGSVLVKLKSQDNISGGHDSEITSCSWVNDKTEPDATSSINILQVELEQEAHSSPGLDSEIAPCSLNDNKLGELGGPPSCNLRVESEDGSYCSPEFDSQIAPYSSNSGVLAETSTITSTSVMPSTEEKYLYSPVLPPTKPFTNVSYEDPQKLLPLPPLQWRLGGPRQGLLSTKGHMPEPVRTNSVLPASCPEIDNRLGSLNGMAELIARVFSQEIKERYQNSMVDNNDQRVEFGKLSKVPTATNVVRTEHDRSFSEACENIKHQGHAPSSETEAEEHLSDTGITDGTALHQSNPLLPFPTYEHGISQQGPQRYILSSDTSNNSEHPSHTYRAASEDDKTVDNHNATGGMHLYTLSSSPTGRVSENGCYQQPQHGESFSETSDNKERSSNASYEQKNLKDQSITSGAPSDTPNHTAPGSMLEEGNSLESQNLQEQNVENSKEDRSEGPSPSAESIVSQDYPPGDHNLEREDIHQPSSAVAWPVDKSNYVSGIDEGSYVHGEQPPVMGWTVGPQMLHPNYGISVEESRFEPEVTDHRLIRKPISIKSIPRNPLVEAVAAHDRSTMRKVSELAAPTDKTKTNERNLLLEQIRNKTFNLKPVGSAKPTAMIPPARASTRNLKVAAIIERANAIRQAVGSDDEDGDNWSDT